MGRGPHALGPERVCCPSRRLRIVVASACSTSASPRVAGRPARHRRAFGPQPCLTLAVLCVAEATGKIPGASPQPIVSLCPHRGPLHLHMPPACGPASSNSAKPATCELLLGCILNVLGKCVPVKGPGKMEASGGDGDTGDHSQHSGSTSQGLVHLYMHFMFSLISSPHGL